mmetsp:Transcript_26264/g.58143  ORF Transcript_26264/g.58143 Transcript_26264/m.58143 type:complete len:208 (+) Transcript_26264:107-730(+)
MELRVDATLANLVAKLPELTAVFIVEVTVEKALVAFVSSTNRSSTRIRWATNIISKSICRAVAIRPLPLLSLPSMLLSLLETATSVTLVTVMSAAFRPSTLEATVSENVSAACSSALNASALVSSNTIDASNVSSNCLAVLGRPVGWEEGCALGWVEGTDVGWRVGCAEGVEEGWEVGLEEGCREGCAEGWLEGWLVGLAECTMATL